ncbi:winged helix-turn-helix transcriptional regulator [Janthinobacterium sp. Ant5-2-1]|uniref:winged helix-turn-helix transcriptional regulator n=1 Tax=Janthinobacterium sp. Ant5-2-1 TaxID=1755239 RepID=UPI0007180821|nr:helix-turn-helix domain-containing protein [Janthinobacterium sp. Ant5-2-1]
MNEETCAPSGVALADTAFGYTLSLIGGKYKMLILYALAANTVLRHNELKRHLGGIAFKTLSVVLKELEADALIVRKEYPQVPPKVEYSLSSKGASLIPVLHTLCEWGERHQPA